jgi:hypothetical protein
VIANCTSPSASACSSSPRAAARDRCGNNPLFCIAASRLRDHGLESADSTAVGRCFGSVLIAKPNSISWITGMPMIMPNVSRSRLSWMNSFRMIPLQRERKRMRASVRFLRFAHQVDEHVLEPGLGALPGDARLGAQRRDRRFQRSRVVAGHVQRIAERSDLATADNPRRRSASRARSGP